MLAQGCRVSMTAALVLMIFTAAATPIAIPLLFGRAFQESVTVSVVLVFAAGISGMNVVFEEGLRGLGEPASVFWGEATGLLVTAIALFFLLRAFGIMGAGVASVLGYLATSFFLLVGIRRSTGLSFEQLLLLKNGDLKIIVEKFHLLRRSMGS
jgi:O-antigen/teichoic acid export membrane protein